MNSNKRYACFVFQVLSSCMRNNTSLDNLTCWDCLGNKRTEEHNRLNYIIYSCSFWSWFSFLSAFRLAAALHLPPSTLITPFDTVFGRCCDICRCCDILWFFHVIEHGFCLCCLPPFILLAFIRFKIEIGTRHHLKTPSNWRYIYMDLFECSKLFAHSQSWKLSEGDFISCFHIHKTLETNGISEMCL